MNDNTDGVDDSASNDPGAAPTEPIPSAAPPPPPTVAPPPPTLPPPYSPTVGAGPDSTDVIPGPADAPTTQVPPIPPPPISGTPPSAAQNPYTSPQQPSPQYGAPPLGGYPGGPPTGPPGPPPPGGPPIPGGPAVAAPWGNPAPEPPKKSSATGWIIALVALFVVGALGVIALFGFVAFSGSGSLEVTVNECTIEADGTLSASGTVGEVSNGNSVQLTIEFVDVETDEVVDTATTSVDVSFQGAGSGDVWSAEGAAGDEVNRVRCDVEATT